MLMVKLKLSYCYNYVKLVNDKAKSKLLLYLHSNIKLMTVHDLRLYMFWERVSLIGFLLPGYERKLNLKTKGGRIILEKEVTEAMFWEEESFSFFKRLKEGGSTT